jgi:ABC-type antimicrobial peptide transport system permease subunit
MKEVVLLLALGLAIGVPAGLGLGQFVSAQLYGIKASDPWIAITSMTILIAVAVTAGLVPAQRASRIDPILALRYE